MQRGKVDEVLRQKIAHSRSRLLCQLVSERSPIEGWPAASQALPPFWLPRELLVLEVSTRLSCCSVGLLILARFPLRRQPGLQFRVAEAEAAGLEHDEEQAGKSVQSQKQKFIIVTSLELGVIPRLVHSPSLPLRWGSRSLIGVPDSGLSRWLTESIPGVKSFTRLR